MPSSYRTKYGLDWEPAGISDVQIELTCAKKWQEPEYKAGNLTDPADHLLRACRLIFPQNVHNNPFIISKWTEEHAYDWTHENFFITWGCAASSKAQPLDSVVYTPTGPRQMGEIQIGDRVIAQDGKTASVLQIHDVGEQAEYRVSFSDGTSTTCAASHLWEVGTRAGGLRRNRVCTTEWLSQQPSPGMYWVPVCEPVYFEERSVLIPPYLMGALLGDGSFGGRSGKGNLRLAAAEPEIVAECVALLDPEYHLRVVDAARGDYALVKRSGVSGGRAPNKYIQAAKHYGLWAKRSPEKHIPDDYLYNSVENRRALLSGLLDTDGMCCKAGAITISTSSEALASGIRTLVQSLGGLATISVHPTSYRKKDGTLQPCRPAHRVSIRMYDKTGMFRCGRKQVRTKNGMSGSQHRYIVSASPTGQTKPMKCITIDHPRGLYLTNDFIATHNSNDMGLFAYLDWSVDPYDTYCLMASTTKEMLQLRSFESVNRYFRILRARREGWPGMISKQHTAIINSEDADATVKASIKGVAVKEGTADESRANLQGVHLPYVRMVADELSQMKEAVMAARFNLMSGASKSFKFVGLCNPDSIYDLAGKYSTPIDGWHTVDAETPEWRTKWGKVRHHNGFFSPAVLEPDGATKYPHLINKAQIDNNITAAGGNLDDPQIWTMVRGFPPPQGLDRTVLTETDIKSFFMQDPPRWQTILHRIAGLDPAFTSDGDGCVLQFADVGFTVDGLLTIGFTDCVNIQLKASADRPITYQIADQVRDALLARGVPVSNLGIDDSGTQSVADIITIEVGAGAHRVVFNAKPSELPLSVGGPPADEKVFDQITELYYLFSEFGRRNQVRGLSADAAQQFCQRRLHPTKRPLRLESKKDVRTRLKRSPDNADACAVALAVARFKLGVAPGASLTEPAGMATPVGPGFNPQLVTRINNLKSQYGLLPGP